MAYYTDPRATIPTGHERVFYAGDYELDVMRCQRWPGWYLLMVFHRGPSSSGHYFDSDLAVYSKTIMGAVEAATVELTMRAVGAQPRCTLVVEKDGTVRVGVPYE